MCDATKNMFACPWLCPRSHQKFSGKGGHSNATWNQSGKGFTACAHWTHLQASDEIFFCIFNRARPVGTILSGHGYAVLFLDPSRGPAFDVGQPGVASIVLGVDCGRPSFRPVEWNAAGEFCATKLSSSPCW